jgi:hypothetical protein
VDQRSFKKQDSVYSQKIKAGKRRTYFIDVKQTKGNDYYITLTESTKKFNSDAPERHKIFVQRGHQSIFAALKDTVDHVKNDLMPDYDFDEFAKRQEELEREYNARQESSEDIDW